MFDKYARHGAYHWDALSPSLRTHNAITAARYLQVMRVCAPVEGHAVLDIGCGDAKLDAMLAEAGARVVVGFDRERTGISTGLGRIARETNGRARARVLLACGDGFHLPVQSGSFDIAVMTDIIEHVSDPLGLVREASRALKPDGVLVITTPYRATEIPLDENHVHEYYPTELEQLLRGAFTSVTIVLSDPLWVVQLYTMGGWTRLFRWFVNILSVFASVNAFLAWPVGRYAGQITAVARGPMR
jgi:SAM-dependent methyltransferase